MFCGAGGLSIGLHGAGFDVVAAVDSWQLAVDTYTKNLPDAATCGDLSQMSGRALCELANIEPGSIDLVAGGPPCQGFSIQRIGRDEDPRNDLVLKFARLVGFVRPRVFLMENVTGLLGKRGSTVFDAFRRQMEKSGYDIRAQIIDAGEYGVPQRRRRVVVTGWLSTQPELPRFEGTSEGVVSVWDAIGDLPPAAPPGSVGDADPLHVASRMSELNQQRLALIPPGGGFEDLPVEMRVQCHARGAAAIGHRGVYGRLDPGKPAGTITARFDSFTRGRFAHPYLNRNITLREGARLQTFPDDFAFLGNREEIAAQIGNAVAPKLSHHLASALHGYLDTMH